MAAAVTELMTLEM